MKIKIKQRMCYDPDCIACGAGNPNSVGAQYYETEDGRVLGIFTGKPMHRSYPHTLHGGISAAILDDCIGRTIQLVKPELWGMTLDMHLTYKKPVPCGETCYVLGELTDEGGKVYSCEGKIILPDGETAVIAEGKFFKVDVGYLQERNHNPDHKLITEHDFCPEYIDVPQ